MPTDHQDLPNICPEYGQQILVMRPEKQWFPIKRTTIHSLMTNTTQNCHIMHQTLGKLTHAITTSDTVMI